MSLGVANRPRAGAREQVVPARSATAHGKRSARARPEQSLVLEALQRGIHGADRQLASRAFGEIVADRESVRVVREANDGEQGGELECPKSGL